jgi:hypothetical protein
MTPLPPVVLWQDHNLICRSRTLAPDRIEITLAHDTVIFEVAFFSNHEAAADFAVSKARAYGVHLAAPPVRDLPD